MLHTPNAGQNMLSHIFGAKKIKKEEKARKLRKNLGKKCFLSLHPNTGQGLLLGLGPYLLFVWFNIINAT